MPITAVTVLYNFLLTNQLQNKNTIQLEKYFCKGPNIQLLDIWFHLSHSTMHGYKTHLNSFQLVFTLMTLSYLLRSTLLIT